MSETWMIHTHDDPLGTIRQLLRDLWRSADLGGLLVPVYQNGDSVASPQFVDDPEKLLAADPCVPFMPLNASKLVPQHARAHPTGRFGAVLRSCEARALTEITRREALDLGNWLVIGVDCLASYPQDDYQWRVEKAGSIEQVSRENLGHARQGGIALHRFRPACQMCTGPQVQDADVGICLLGLPVRHVLLVRAKDEDTAERLQLEQITDDIAPAPLLAQHEKTVRVLNERRKRTLDRMVAALSVDLPDGVDDLIAHLRTCPTCLECLSTCPIYAFEIPSGEKITREAAVRWLVSCVSCGMCEQACPDHLPLTAVIRRIREELRAEMVPA